ncbi:MAG: secretin N-terminal domain-containing protein [Endomicrobiaceae bacterium]|nr:secretin N-terminal domain-containing protein [Endomicrobiaceae bacterium]MDD4165821.1 secretin N-terminal domain-containing protein [Endomicrobiaceae bacterium]
MKKQLVVLILFITLLFNPVVSFGEKSNEVTSSALISIDFQGTTLYTVLNVLSMKTGMKLISDTTLYNKKIMLSLKDVTAEEALNALLDTYDLYYVKQGDANIYVIKSKDDKNHITVSRVIFCNYAKSGDLEKILETRLSTGGKIVSDVRTNSIIITDLADSIDKMEGLIRSLDIPTQQVMLEAKIVDVNISKGLSIGTQINQLYRTGTGNTNPLTGSPNFFYKNSNSDGESGSFLSLNKSFGQVGVSILQGDWNIDAVIEAGIENKTAKILTNPKLLVLNNQEASIDIVEEVPYLESKTTSSSTGDVTGTMAFKQVGIKLRVKPQINRDGSIVLQVSPEQSFRTGEMVGGTDGTPVVNTSKTTTTLMLRSGETAAIGGLIRETEDGTERKVPLLGDIPLLGYLFKGVEQNKTRYELTIFITAKIVN